ncbi:hypothetical protein GCM10012290_21740 [Halolactibacillus alkaliphilus]|uniref:RNA-binding protein KhpB N-terminal domain-containing protein n=1 Tax=Halolactibacillus alkaliphilus TaxID=442899 RepID=A0A511X3R2_9BACI|nr:FapA family protein [Halolactibacillus alkaliphilus]GEN57592.1 hypothetical protein HAL01_20560 [Halolactibacillus alkaliphilus]GGN74162.1 hypothetical protein GCM10012290_21740 [Halolactibacillus alkaliphilus]SFP00730.1 hypothetical protein SAMN05720591_13128 [Halolactibacillus alkaliphilus]
MGTFLSKGKTVREAIDLGLSTLKMDQTHVEIEVIQLEKRGILGIGNKDALVKLTYQSQSHVKVPNPLIKGTLPDTDKSVDGMGLEDFLDYLEDAEESKKIANELNDNELDSLAVNKLTEARNETAGGYEAHQSLSGKVWVKDGELHVKDSDEHQPSLKLEQGLCVKKNGEVIEDTFVFISEFDEIAFFFEEKAESTEWKIVETDDKLKAELHIRPGFERKIKLKDTVPGYQITIETIEDIILKQTITHEDILHDLAERGINYGINQRAIDEALSSLQGGLFVIAEGVAADEGKDGWLEVRVRTQAEDTSKDNTDLSAINFRERKQIPTVEKGQVLAVIHPAITGKPGRSIKDEVIVPKQPRELKIVTQKGTIKLENRIVANENGRPFIEKRGTLVKTKVLPQMVHDGDVDLSSGNITFRGDVEVKGDVTEGMQIQSGGHVTIHQTVNGATIRALQSIHIGGNANRSNIASGSHVDLTLQHVLSGLYYKLLDMHQMMEQIMRSPKFKNSSHKRASITSMILLLKEKRFKTLSKEIQYFNQLVTNEKKFLIEEEWEEVNEALKKIFFRIPQVDVSFVMFEHLLEQMRNLIDLSAMQNNEDADLFLKNALNSRLLSAGDIVVLGRSCINSTIKAEGFVTVKGIVRGGELYAKKGCDLYEVGGQMGVRTLIKTAEDGKIRIHKVHEGTVVKVGGWTHTFEENHMNVVAYLNEEGELRLIFQ